MSQPPRQPRLDLRTQGEADRVAGVVQRVTFHSEESGFCVLRLKLPGRRELATVVGRAPRVTPGEFAEALKSFDLALGEEPDHRGALMGRAVVFIQTERYSDAIEELTYLIGRLEATLESDDTTGRGALAAAYANRGVVHDREARYESALTDYVRSLQIDEGVTEGRGIFDQILYGYRPSTVRDRAIYLQEQLQLPEDQRVMQLPERDAEQRMHKP